MIAFIAGLVIVTILISIAVNSSKPNSVKELEWREKEQRGSFAGFVILAMLILPIVVICVS